MKSIFAVFVFALTSAASAQEYRERQARAAEQAYEGLQAGMSGQAAAARRAAETAKIRSYALDAALTAMNDGVEAGGRVVASLGERKLDVFFATQAEAVTTGAVNGRPAILLSDALPPHPRVYAALIASEAAKGMYAGMPACAERAYMRSATAARVFAELGGDFKSLPVVDGDKADAVAAAVSAWKDDAQTALERAGRAEGVPELPELQEKASDPKTAAALDAANRAFTAFLLDEREARASAR
ncbi:MAG: hypothetical protein HY077_11410 [Elusimicrobia bacterium]|nr:hypothetical protein [Elusimicrobiota bacterium]